MKYTIVINQFAAIQSGLDLDIVDLAIFDFIKDFANSDKCMKMQTPEGVYFWISHKLVMEAMPLLNIKTNQGLTKRINKLLDAGILKKHPKCDFYSKTLYCFGSNYELLTFADNVTEVTPPKQKLVGGETKVGGDPLNESWGYNNIKEDNNNNNKEPAQSKILFRTCFPGIDKGDYSELEEVFGAKDYENIDICYYFNAVADWSDQSNTKRTRRGWLATIRTFMRGDKEKGKLKMITPQTSAKRINVADAMDFLNDNY